jgi:hypothetical protein
MIQRCTNPKDPRWKWYGARGITVCDRWRHSFESFFTDMGPRPSASLSIDRIDSLGNYEPGNCRWADATTQARNRRTNVLVEAFGETLTISAWSERFSVSPVTLSRRLARGIPVETALTHVGRVTFIRGEVRTHKRSA